MLWNGLFFKSFRQGQSQSSDTQTNYYGIQSKANTWIPNFLSNPTQDVLLEGEASDYISGVPQGSVLGLSLFLFYINDIPDGITPTVRLWAA